LWNDSPQEIYFWEEDDPSSGWKVI
jgi:hypothetical protein